MGKKIMNSKDYINTEKVMALIKEYTENNEYDKLVIELESLHDYFCKNKIFIPVLEDYIISHYYNSFSFKANCSRYIKYLAKVPLKDWKKDHLLYIIEIFAQLRYEEIASDDEYITFMNIIHTLTKPENENILIIKDNHMFKKLKVGFLSSDLGGHVVGWFLLALLNNKLNYETIQYYAYSTKVWNDAIHKVIKENIYMFRDVSNYSDKKLSDVILEDNLDILIDLNGLSKHSKTGIMTSRLAPVQMSYIGFPGTTGYYNIDYTIVDKITDPPEFSQSFYTEKLLYTDKTFLCYSYNPPESMISYELPYMHNGFITIGSFANPHKYSDKLLCLWKIIMDKLPDARFFVQSFFLKTDEDIDIQKQRFSSFGIDTDKITFYMASQRNDYLNNYNKVDFVLDTFPFNGATTTCDALSMSVPIITLTGHTHVSRTTASMLINMGLPELITDNDEEYITKTIALANDTEKLALLRRTIRDKFIQSPLVDAVSFKIDLERKFRDVYIKYVLEHNLSRTPDSTDISILASEALTSVFYLQNIMAEVNIDECEVLPKILKESSFVNLMLCKFLQETHAGNVKALKTLEHYDNLSKLLNKNPDKNTLNILLNSIIKIISMFIS